MERGGTRWNVYQTGGSFPDHGPGAPDVNGRLPARWRPVLTMSAGRGTGARSGPWMPTEGIRSSCERMEGVFMKVGTMRVKRWVSAASLMVGVLAATLGVGVGPAAASTLSNARDICVNGGNIWVDDSGESPRYSCWMYNNAMTYVTKWYFFNTGEFAFSVTVQLNNGGSSNNYHPQ
jgi:hypothetical protein